MAKEDRVLTIDVGGGNLKMAEFAFSPGGAITLTGFGFRRFDPSGTDENAPSFLQVYHEMLAEHKFTARGVRLSLSSQTSFQRLSKLPPMLGNRSAITRVVEYEARQAVPYAMSEVEWDYQLIRHQWEETRVESDEDGSTHEVTDPHEEYEALFIAVKSEEISAYTNVIEDSGREILSVEIAPVALFNAAKAAQQVRDDECVLLVNIGFGCTSLVICDRNRIFMRSIPIAGETVTLGVAREFGMENKEAEELKIRHGFVALGGAYEDSESALESTISKIARGVMTRLHGEISRSVNVWRAMHGGNAPTRVLLAGGGSTMLYVTDFFQEKLRLPVSYLNCFGAIAISPSVNREELQLVAPMFQELIGMSLRSVTVCPVDISLVPKLIRKQRDLDRRKPFFYISAGVAVLCLSVFALGVNKLLDFDGRRAERVKGEVKRITAKMNAIKELKTQCDRVAGEYNEAADILKKRNAWFEMLEELQTMIPDTMWLVVLEGVGDPSDAPSAAEGGGNPQQSAGGNPFLAVGGAAGAGSNSAVSADLREVKRLHLVGYTLSLPGHQRLEAQLESKLKNSRHFTDEWVLGENRKVNNLSCFEIFLRLREPIRK